MISASGSAEQFVSSSSERRRKPIVDSTSARRCAAFSPTPPVNVTASIPPKALTIAAMAARSRCTYTSRASRAAGVTIGGQGFHLCHVRRAGQRVQPRFVLERVGDVADRNPLLLGQPQDQARVDRARAGRHDESLQGREPHRRVDRSAFDDGSQGGTRTQMAGDHADASAGVSHELDRPSPRVAVAQTVETKATHAPSSPAIRVARRTWPTLRAGWSERPYRSRPPQARRPRPRRRCRRPGVRPSGGGAPAR